MSSSLKCNQFSIIHSTQDNLGNGKPQLTLHKAVRRERYSPRWDIQPHTEPCGSCLCSVHICAVPTAAVAAQGPTGDCEEGQELRQKQSLQLILGCGNMLPVSSSSASSDAFLSHPCRAPWSWRWLLAGFAFTYCAKLLN